MATDLCLILPVQHVGSPERVRVLFKVTQPLVLELDLLAHGSGCCAPSLVKKRCDHLSGEFNNE